MPSSVVSVINYKGGVGKTTLTANLGADLAARGRRVLLIDLDPQASLTFSFFRVPEWETQLADALNDDAFAGYDAVLIDCAPNFNMVTRNAIVASDYVLVPARLDYLSTLGIDYLRTRLSRLIEDYNGKARSPINPEIVGVVYTMIQRAGTGMLKAQLA